MLQDVHTQKIAIPVLANLTGDNIIIAPVAGAWIYIHELMGDLDVSGTLQVKCGSVVKGEFGLDAGQGFTLSDESGEDNRPRLQCRPGESFILNLSAGSIFKGTVHYSLRY